MFRGAVKRLGTKATKQQQREVHIVMIQAIVGAGLGILGATKAVQNIL